jgi:hypothetical protein
MTEYKRVQRVKLFHNTDSYDFEMEERVNSFIEERINTRLGDISNDFSVLSIAYNGDKLALAYSELILVGVLNENK